MRILSIDWDYFMKCSVDTRMTDFPDGGDEGIGSALSTHIWTTRYAQANAAGHPISDIKVREKELDVLKKVIEANRDKYYYAVADSHKHLGEFLLHPDMERKLDDEGIEIIHIDHHHDIYDAGETLNCGNWLTKVIERYPNTVVTWIGNSDSQMPEKDMPATFYYTDDIHEAQKEFVDMIYLCRSGVWSCPHLDKEFGALNRYIQKRSIAAIFREEIPNRWDDDMKKYIKETAEMLLKVVNKNAASE